MNSPRMRRFGKLLLVVFALACVLTTAAFAEGDAEVVSAVHGTIASLLPPVVAIGLALITKEVYSSLFLGILVGCFLQVNGNPIDAFQFFVTHVGCRAHVRRKWIDCFVDKKPVDGSKSQKAFEYVEKMFALDLQRRNYPRKNVNYTASLY